MRNRRPLRGLGTETGPESAPWLLTFSDMMTQVLAFFILLYAISSVNEAKFRASVVSLQQAIGLQPGSPALVGPAPGGAGSPAQSPSGAAALAAVQGRIAEALAAVPAGKDVRFDQRDGALIIRLDATALFDSGRADVRRDAVPLLDAIAAGLKATPNQIRIEGHTDSDPMIPNPQFPDNWMLSGARAAGVVRFFHEFHGVPWDRLSFAGYADTRPIATNKTPEGKARNRRVDIVVIGR